MGKLPAIQMYTGDWKKDPAVRSCSIAARGLWWEILQSMFDCPERGILKTGDKVWGIPEIAADAGIPTSQAAVLLAELEKRGVPSRREGDNALFCRRMVRDEEQRQKWRDQKREQRDVRDLSARCPPASSFTSSSSNQKPPAKTAGVISNPNLGKGPEIVGGEEQCPSCGGWYRPLALKHHICKPIKARA